MRLIPSSRIGRFCVIAMLATVSSTALAAPAVAHTVKPRPVTPLAVTTIFTGSSHGWSSPDDLTHIGDSLFVSFQNGVPSTGGSNGGPTQSTIVKLSLNGAIQATWQLTGKCDGLTADPAHHRVIATVNEDGNSSLYTIPAHGVGAPTHYNYDIALPHGGGTDSITIYRGGIYVAASAPAVATGPALYRVTLHSGVAHIAGEPFLDSSTATRANTGGMNAPVTLALTDPDSSTVVPRSAARFAGNFMLDSQGDQQAIFASRLGTHHQKLQVLDLNQAVDDTAFASSREGILVATDSTADSVVVFHGGVEKGVAYTSVTPANANTPPVPTPANYLGTIDLRTGVVTAVPTSGPTPATHSLIYLSSQDMKHDRLVGWPADRHAGTPHR